MEYRVIVQQLEKDEPETFYIMTVEDGETKEYKGTYDGQHCYSYADVRSKIREEIEASILELQNKLTALDKPFLKEVTNTSLVTIKKGEKVDGKY